MEFSGANSAAFQWESAWGSGSGATLIGNKVIQFTPRLVLISLLYYIEKCNYLQIISQINCLNLHMNNSAQSYILLCKRHFSVAYKGPDFKRRDRCKHCLGMFCWSYVRIGLTLTIYAAQKLIWAEHCKAANLIWNDLTENL